MHLTWIVDAPAVPAPDPESLATSVIASQRLRVALPARTLAAAGHEQVVTALPWAAAPDAPLRTDVAVFSKILPRSEAHVQQHYWHARRLRVAGARIVVDICDPPFVGMQAPYLRELVALADLVLANSPAMADLIEDQADRPAVVIPDPVEGLRQPPRFAPQARAAGWLRRGGGPLRLLWFGGSPLNYGWLQPWLPHLARLGESDRLGIQLQVVAADLPEIAADVARFAPGDAPGLHMRFEPWSLAAMHEALAGCDLVLIPGDGSGRAKSTVSTNRLGESVHAGRFVVASGIPSYWEFRDSAWIGEDLVAGIRWSIAHPEEARRRIHCGQQRIDAAYAPAVVGAAWQRALTTLA